MSHNFVPEKAADAAPSLPAFIPSIIATAILSLAVGYWIGVGNSLSPFGRPQRRHRQPSPPSGKETASSSSENSSEDDEVDSAALLHESLGDSTEECKMARSLYMHFL
jgi:hypothetical protein